MPTALIRVGLAGIAALALVACETPNNFASTPAGPVLVNAPEIFTAPNQAFNVTLATAPDGVDGIVPLGSEMAIGVVSQRAGFAAVYVLSPNGKVSVLAENRPIQAGVPLRLPGAESYRLIVHPPAGREHVLAVVSSEPLPGSTVRRPPSVAEGLTQPAFLTALQSRLDALPRGTWAATHKRFDTGL